jgi:hypothetical protein
MKRVSQIFLSVLSVLTFFAVTSATPLNTKWYTSSLDVNVGDTININVYVAPEFDQPVGTVSNSVLYDPDYLKFKETKLADGWFDLSTDTNNLTDEINGMLRRTAGFPGGTNTYRKYMTYTFVAQKEGVTKVNVEDGVALDQNNEDLGIVHKSMTFTITALGTTTEATTTEPVDRYIDYSISTSGRTAIREGDDYIFLVNLNQIPVEGDLGSIEYVLEDSDQNVIYNNELLFGPGEFSKEVNIPSQYLKAGEYTIYVRTYYQNSENEVEITKQLGVLATDRTFFDVNKRLFFISFAIITFFAFAWHLHHDRDVFRALMTKRPARRKQKMLFEFAKRFFVILFVVIASFSNTYAATNFAPNQTIDPLLIDPSCTPTTCFVVASTTNSTSTVLTLATITSATTTNLYSSSSSIDSEPTS